MANASAPFRAKSPFHSKILGLDYQSFGLDFINPPPVIPFGCLSVTPLGVFNSSGHEGGPFTPSSQHYTITNIGGTEMFWSVSVNQSWLYTDTPGGLIQPGESQTVDIILNADLLVGNPVPYTALVTWTNVTNGCGNTTSGVSLSIIGNIALTVQGRTKGGTATLIGYSEYASPSSPPKKYRTQTMSGGVTNEHFPAPSCAGAPDCSAHYEWAGSCYYDAITGLFTTAGTRTQTGSCLGNGVIPSCFLTYTPALGDVLNSTQTTQTVTNSTFTCFISGGEALRRTLVDESQVLTNEDTQADGIVRLMNASSYTGYSTAAAIGDIKSQYEQRTTLFTFTYQYAQYKLTAIGLTPSTLYNGSATIYRRLWASSDPWAFVSTVVVSGTTDIAGNFTYGPFDLPVAAGYEYTIWNAALS